MNELRQFTEKFFNNLKCELSWESNLLTIKKVPKEFEDFYGKKSPYIISFDKPIENTEFLTRGSFLLKAMTSYLENVGQTTLIKLDFNRNYKKEFEHYLKLRNSHIYNLITKEEYKSILRYTFLTTLQYLNEKEQVINSIFTKNTEVINFNLEKYEKIEGKKEDIKSLDLKEGYEPAKNHLKELLKNRILETSTILNNKLKREQERIKEHFKQQEKEIFDSINRYEEQIKNLEKQLQKEESDKELINNKIVKIKDQIENIKNSGQLEKIKKEEEFFLTDENHKHSLNISNKLINTTIVYYPIFHFQITLKNNDSARQIEVTYDPMKDVINNPITCESCKRETNELFLCLSGHITCNNCFERCRSCEKGLCYKCTKKECDYCTRKLCKKCAVQCFECSRFVCASHMKKNYLNDNNYCPDCILQCSYCNQYTDKKHMKKDGNQRNICEKCRVLNSIKVHS